MTIRAGCAEYTVSMTVGAPPAGYPAFLTHARLHDDFRAHGTGGTPLAIAVERTPSRWPDLLVSLRFEPGPSAGFHPGVFLVPETDLLFMGAGTRLLAYELRTPRRLWEDAAEAGFWGWRRHGDVVVMSAELELAAWDIGGEKLWSTFVEPPWSYDVRETHLHLDVIGKTSSFEVRTGPDPGRVR